MAFQAAMSKAQAAATAMTTEKQQQQQRRQLHQGAQQRLNSVDLEERPGNKTKRGGFWARLKCW